MTCNVNKERQVTQPSMAAEPPIAGGSRSSTMNILGITIDERLSVSGHVNNILGSCSYSIYALRTLRARGMTGQTLHDVTRATTLGRLMYASPSWWGSRARAGLSRPILKNLGF